MQYTIIDAPLRCRLSEQHCIYVGYGITKNKELEILSLTLEGQSTKGLQTSHQRPETQQSDTKYGAERPPRITSRSVSLPAYRLAELLACLLKD